MSRHATLSLPGHERVPFWHRHFLVSWEVYDETIERSVFDDADFVGDRGDSPSVAWAGTYTTLFSFNVLTGWEPEGDLTLSGSTLYGMTSLGGT